VRREEKEQKPSLGTYWRTIRHLKPIQIWGRIWNQVPRPGPRKAGRLEICPARTKWKSEVVRKAEMEGPKTFRILNEKRTIRDGKWDPPEVPKLWRYHLHYFGDLNAKAAGERWKWHRDLITSWILENPAGQGTGWEPYPTSRRIVNWVKYFLAGEVPQKAWLESLAIQADWVSRRVEWHLLGNHVLANAKALVFAGSYFEGIQARSWQEKGMMILQEQIPRQILPDGGHEERSPMYQALVLEDILDLMQLGCLFSGLGERVCKWRGKAEKVLDWLLAMTHPDGGVSFFNDAAEGMAGRMPELTRYAARMGIRADKRRGVRAMRKAGGSGYFRLEEGPATVIGDLAPLGPDHLPAHGHADTLSFEMSLGKKRILVNGGSSEYGTGLKRQRERGTAAHNTVMVGGENSSEVWGGFRVGRRARVLGRRVGERSAEGSHNGYRFLTGSPIHCRKWKLTKHQLRVEDRIKPPITQATARFHLAPGLRYEQLGGAWLIRDRQNVSAKITISGGRGRIEKSHHAEEFGRLVETECLMVDFRAGWLQTDLRWKDQLPVKKSR
jgi:uncharacterized heparinase superfamily protein